MKQVLLLCVFSIVLFSQLRAQDSSAWKTAGTIGANVTQVSLSDWGGGGQNSVALTGLFAYTAAHKTAAADWDNSLDVSYGMTKLGSKEFRKSDDKFIFISKYGYKASEQLRYAALLDLRTQLTEGLSYDEKTDTVKERVSNIFAPANIFLGFGASYEPAEYFSITIAPVSNRILIVADDSLNKYRAFGVDSGKVFKSDIGVLVNITFNKELMKNVTLNSKFSSFGPYADFNHHLLNWNSLLTLKVNDYINANVALDVIYDHKTVNNRDDKTIGPRAQIRNVLGIGFGYKF